MSRKQPEPEDDARTVLPIGEYFPNGLPKVVFWYEMDDDIHVVTNKSGKPQHVLEDIWLSLDLKKGMHISHIWEMKARDNLWDESAPKTWDFSTDYNNSDVEAAEYILIEQRRLEREGIYVPIAVRD